MIYLKTICSKPISLKCQTSQISARTTDASTTFTCQSQVQHTDQSVLPPRYNATHHNHIGLGTVEVLYAIHTGTKGKVIIVW